MKNKIKIIVTVILFIIVIANCWIAFSKLVLKNDLPSFFGLKNAVVLSGSMEPVFSAGDLLIYFETKDYEIDDIVIFLSGGAFVTHRIIGEEDGYFITQGDANNVEDKELLNPENIEGEMIIAIPSIGSFINFLSTPLGLLILIFLGIAVFEVPKFFEKEEKNMEV